MGACDVRPLTASVKRARATRWRRWMASGFSEVASNASSTAPSPDSLVAGSNVVKTRKKADRRRSCGRRGGPRAASSRAGWGAGSPDALTGLSAPGGERGRAGVESERGLPLARNTRVDTLTPSRSSAQCVLWGPAVSPALSAGDSIAEWGGGRFLFSREGAAHIASPGRAGKRRGTARRPDGRKGPCG